MKRKANQPHASYDIDGDGFISQSDYQLAKRFDADGNGVIDKEEMDAGKRLIAKELWERYRAQHFLQKPPITDTERQRHVDDLVRLKDEHGAFMRDYERVKNKHWIEEQRGSAQVLECVSKPNDNMYQPTICQHPVCVTRNRQVLMVCISGASQHQAENTDRIICRAKKGVCCRCE